MLSREYKLDLRAGSTNSHPTFPSFRPQFCMRIAEIYESVQGEGALTGTPSVFVRTSGCNLRCWYCDTPYASWSPEGSDLGVAETLDRVLAYAANHVVITGGEPMLFAELVPLSQALRAAGRHVTIETAGTLDLPVECDLMSISPKLAGSGPRGADHDYWRRRHEAARIAPAVLRRFFADYEYQLKFVIERREDVQLVDEFLLTEPSIDHSRVWLMPEGIDSATLQERGAWIESLCAERDWRFCPRRHIEWFGLRRGV